MSSAQPGSNNEHISGHAPPVSVAGNVAGNTSSRHEPVAPGPSVTQASRAPRTSRTARTAPYARPTYPPKPTTPLPPSHPNGSRTQAGDTSSAIRKRRLEKSPELSSNVTNGHSAPRAQVISQTQTPGAGPSTNQATVGASLVDATRQLAQPRDIPGHSQHDYDNAQPNGTQPNSNIPQPSVPQPNIPQPGVPQPNVAQPDDIDFEAADDDEEELMEGLQEDNEEITRLIHEGEDEKDGNQRLCRLVARMFQKQDTIYRTLRGLKHSRRAPGNKSRPAPDSQAPPRTSPPQPGKPVNWDQSVPSTEPAGRQRRVARRILISDNIRQNINKLLKRTSRKQPLPPPPPAEIRYPTLENFGIRWEGMEKSVFNRMAADILVTQVRQNWRDDALTESELLELPGMVSEHIRYLCRVWKNAHREDAETLKKNQLKNASASSRRATLYESRLKIIDRFPQSLNMHRNLIVRLGVAGTSSDEEHPVRKGVFLIKRRPELSSQVQVLKSKLDLAYNLYCKGPGSKGSQMHTREPSDMVSARTPMFIGLPVTCLSRTWLRTLSGPEREFYQFQGHIYDYRFPDALLRRDTGRQPHMVVMSDEDIEEDEEL